MSKHLNWDHAFPPFQSVQDAVASTGLSRYYLQAGIRDGSVPYIRSGRRILINVPALLERLNEESTRH